MHCVFLSLCVYFKLEESSCLCGLSQAVSCSSGSPAYVWFRLTFSSFIHFLGLRELTFVPLPNAKVWGGGDEREQIFVKSLLFPLREAFFYQVHKIFM